MKLLDFLVLAFIFCATILSTQADPIMVCYVAHQAYDRMGFAKFVSNDIHKEFCTHYVYSFPATDSEPLTIPLDYLNVDFNQKIAQRVADLKMNGAKVIFSLGKSNNSGDKYGLLVKNPAIRIKFVNDVVQFIKRHDFDGFDFDWEVSFLFFKTLNLS